jgi:hypothetical protein
MLGQAHQSINWSPVVFFLIFGLMALVSAVVVWSGRVDLNGPKYGEVHRRYFRIIVPSAIGLLSLAPLPIVLSVVLSSERGTGYAVCEVLVFVLFGIFFASGACGAGILLRGRPQFLIAPQLRSPDPRTQSN